MIMLVQHNEHRNFFICIITYYIVVDTCFNPYYHRKYTIKDGSIPHKYFLLILSKTTTRLNIVMYYFMIIWEELYYINHVI